MRGEPDAVAVEELDAALHLACRAQTGGESKDGESKYASVETTAPVRAGEEHVRALFGRVRCLVPLLTSRTREDGDCPTNCSGALVVRLAELLLPQGSSTARPGVRTILDLALARIGLSRLTQTQFWPSEADADTSDTDLAASIDAMRLVPIASDAAFVVGASNDFAKAVAAVAACDALAAKKHLTALGLKAGVRESASLLACVYGDGAPDVAFLATVAGVSPTVAFGFVGLATGSRVFLRNGARAVAHALGFSDADVMASIVRVVHGAANATGGVDALASALDIDTDVLTAIVASSNTLAFMQTLRDGSCAASGGFANQIGLDPDLLGAARVLCRLVHADRGTIAEAWPRDTCTRLVQFAIDIALAESPRMFRRALHELLLDLAHYLYGRGRASSRDESSATAQAVVCALFSQSGASSIDLIASRLHVSVDDVVCAFLEEWGGAVRACRGSEGSSADTDRARASQTQVCWRECRTRRSCWRRVMYAICALRCSEPGVPSR